jgi:hypothetical protein
VHAYTYFENHLNTLLESNQVIILITIPVTKNYTKNRVKSPPYTKMAYQIHPTQQWNWFTGQKFFLSHLGKLAYYRMPASKWKIEKHHKTYNHCSHLNRKASGPKTKIDLCSLAKIKESSFA